MAEFPGKRNGSERHGIASIRFGAFEADLYSGEVRKDGVRIKLQEQPFKVLQILLERPGVLVTRDELQSRIWPEDTFGDFDHAVNVAVGKLRTALGDSADDPTYIETVPRRGYRFKAKLDAAPIASFPAPVLEPIQQTVPLPPGPSLRKRVLFSVCLLASCAALVGLGVLLGHHGVRARAPEYQRLTLRHGTIYSARFAPDGHSVVYTAAWDGEPPGLYSTDVQTLGTRGMEMPQTQLLSISSTGEMAVLQVTGPRFMLSARGTLGRVPMSGGTPRQIAENIDWADWSPDGKTLAVVREIAGKQRLEYPMGHVLYERVGRIGHPRISPQGDKIAFMDYPAQHDDQGVVSVVDLSGRKQVLSTGWESEEGLAWSPNGKEVWFSATTAGLERRIYAVDLAGHLRLAYRALGGVTLEDIAHDGTVLLTRDENRAGMVGMAPGASKEKDLSWLNWSLPVDLSADGNTLLFDEQGEQGGPTYTVATRSITGSPPVPLGEGMAGDLSPDGKWAAATVSYTQIVLLPTGAGTIQRINNGGIEGYGHEIHWLPGGKQIVFSGSMQGRLARCFVQDISGGLPRPITPEGMTECGVSPDGLSIIARGGDDNPALMYPLDGGAPHAIPGLQAGESFARSSDPEMLYVYQSRQQPLRIFRLNVQTGERRFFREFHTLDPIGLCDMSHILLTPDGRAYVYSYTRLLSDLYLVKGVS